MTELAILKKIQNGTESIKNETEVLPNRLVSENVTTYLVNTTNDSEEDQEPVEEDFVDQKLEITSEMTLILDEENYI